MTEEEKKPDTGTAPAQFSELGVPVGCAITLETLAGSRRMSARLIGYMEQKSIMIGAPVREGKELLLERGESLVVRFLHRNHVCGFESKVLYRCIQPFSYYHLDYPKLVDLVTVRDSERIGLNIAVKVNSDFDAGILDWPQMASIKDISKSGISVTSSNTLGEIGHELILEFDLPVTGSVRHFDLDAVIRNRNVVNAKDGRSLYAYGMQFLNLSDADRLALASYLYEQSV